MNSEIIVLPDDIPRLGAPEPGSLLEAANDLDAANAWVKAKSGEKGEGEVNNTRDAYRREGGRFLIWLGVNNLSIGAMRVEHANRYFDLLRDPPPEWVRRKGVKNSSSLLSTQLLTGPLSEKSIKYSWKVLNQLCGYLQDAGYIKRNAIRLASKPKSNHEDAPSQRLLDIEAWQWLWNWLCTHPASTPSDVARNNRDRWIFILLYHTGIRRAEVASSTMSKFQRRDGNWVLEVIGKGNKTRFVTVSEALLNELRRYRIALNLTPDPSPDDENPIVLSLNGARRKKRLTPRAIALIIESVVKRAIEDCENEHIKSQIDKMTTHWMRHTNATHRLRSGALIETTQDELGHSDVRTTRMYIHTTKDQRKSDAEKLADLHGF